MMDKKMILESYKNYSKIYGKCLCYISPLNKLNTFSINIEAEKNKRFPTLLKSFKPFASPCFAKIGS